MVEVLSRRGRVYDPVRKKAMYATAGVREYWIVDPFRRTLTIFTLADGQYEQVEHATGLARSTVVPGFAIAISEAFTRLKDDDEG
ncbi:MAG: Uma2 family endonuclease [Chloroflexia bacterium]|nr:Uma2 family endonuclease [Chloroflexia bacterium]